MASGSEYIWPQYTASTFETYVPPPQPGPAPRRPFQDLIDYEMPPNPGPSNFVQPPAPQFQVASEQSASPNKGKRRAIDRDDSTEKPRVERRGGPRIPKGIEMYTNFQSAMDALKLVMLPNVSDVDFSANFLVEDDPPVPDKERVKVLAHEIWRATGYRFTIKDHPQLKEGHKTRYWCAQDESGRSKSKGPASADSKIRYPCKSSLLVSCKCDDPDSPTIRLMTIRLHHHLTHDRDPERPTSPETQINWKSPLPQNYHHPHPHHSHPPNHFNGHAPNPSIPKKRQRQPRQITSSYLGVAETDGLLARVRPPPAFLGGGKMSWKKPPAPTPAMLIHNDHIVTNAANLGMDTMDHHHLPMDVSPPDPPSSIPHPTAAAPSSTLLVPQSVAEALSPSDIQERMKNHIRNIREFCDGLEYNLQFSEQGMLNLIETNGKGFLDVVHDCLRSEGRLHDAPG